MGTLTGIKAGSAIAIAEMMVLKKPDSLKAATFRYLYWTVPLAGIGCAYATTFSLAKEMRGKDDPLNHVIGTAAASSIIGARYGTRAGAQIFVVFGSFIAFIKLCHGRGLNVMGPELPYYKDYGGFNRVVIGPRSPVREPTDY